MSRDAGEGVEVVEVVEIGRAHPSYRDERRIRFEVLRRPLGMPEGSEENRREAECRHWVAVVSRTDGSGEPGETVGTVLWLPEAPPELGRLLQMAVVPERQATGIGRRLVVALEEAVGAAGFREVTLHARDIAVGFYERLGYEVYGEPFVEVGIPHRHMRKVLR